ncbi:MAG TPA: hypothetical protein VK939_11260 [Longimicrobiales bacterium]|nr:hypothetical protein [Longimicrobiales bacterium]
MPRKTLMRALLPLAASATLAGSARAQTQTLDEGTFRILIEGAEVGMETFAIRQNGVGADAVVIAHGRIVLDAGRGGQEVQANVQLAGGSLRPALYDVEVRGGDAQRINARVSGSRVSARISSPAGENMREYLVSEGAVLVDEGVAHHYFFLLRRAPEGGSVPVVVPRISRQVSTRVERGAAEETTVAGARLAATRYHVQPAGSVPEAHVWADAEGRILRVEVPGKNYVAVRTARP